MCSSALSRIRARQFRKQVEPSCDEGGPFRARPAVDTALGRVSLAYVGKLLLEYEPDRPTRTRVARAVSGLVLVDSMLDVPSTPDVQRAVGTFEDVEEATHGVTVEDCCDESVVVSTASGSWRVCPQGRWQVSQIGRQVASTRRLASLGAGSTSGGWPPLAEQRRPGAARTPRALRSLRIIGRQVASTRRLASLGAGSTSGGREWLGRFVCRGRSAWSGHQGASTRRLASLGAGSTSGGRSRAREWLGRCVRRGHSAASG